MNVPKLIIMIEWRNGEPEEVKEYAHWLEDKEVKDYLLKAILQGAKITVQKGESDDSL